MIRNELIAIARGMMELKVPGTNWEFVAVVFDRDKLLVTAP
jgi:hypothetical protein